MLVRGLKSIYDIFNLKTKAASNKKKEKFPLHPLKRKKSTIDLSTLLRSIDKSKSALMFKKNKPKKQKTVI